MLGKRYKLLYVVSVRAYCVVEYTKCFVTYRYDWLSLWKRQSGNYLHVRHVGIITLCKKCKAVLQNLKICEKLSL